METRIITDNELNEILKRLRRQFKATASVYNLNEEVLIPFIFTVMDDIIAEAGKTPSEAYRIMAQIAEENERIGLISC